MQEKQITALLYGNLHKDPSKQIKYGMLFDALSSHYPGLDIYNTDLEGLPRLVNAAVSFHPDRQLWKERFYKNLPAFRMRSKGSHAYLTKHQKDIDLVLQIGCLQNPNWKPLNIPVIIYTDYISSLSAEKAEGGYGRSPFNSSQQEKWIQYEKDALFQADHIFSRSHFVKERMLQDYGLPNEKISVVGGGFNFPPLDQMPEREFTKEGKILFIGKDFYRKGGDLLLKAFREVVFPAVPGSRLQMVTSYPAEMGDPGLAVEIIAPTYDRQKIQELYKQADVFCLCSRLETWGDVILEANAFGLPCVAVQGEAFDELIQNRETGITVPHENILALGDALKDLLLNPRERQRMGKNAFNYVNQEFTWSSVVRRMLPTINSLIPSE
ncbi:MAG: glycosyltransferase family 4 protein [Anaerolineaceae bacterium]|nr:glycosyltransferase family 4 protein [Anaerolineaceae bacterium]